VKYRNKLVIILFFSHFFNIYSLSPIEMVYQESPASQRHLVLYFPQMAIDQNMCAIATIEQDALKEINNRLIERGCLIPYEAQDMHQWGSLKRISYRIKRLYYSLFYYTRCSEYPDRLNYAFFERKDPFFGFYTVYIPDGVPFRTFSSLIQSVYKEKKVECYIDADIGVYLAAKDEKNESASEKNYFTLAQLEGKDAKNLLWHQSFPTTGLLLEEPYYPPCYPYMPHFFSLHELAPSKGMGITIALIDTGACAFQVQGDAHYYKHRDLSLNYRQVGLENLSITNNRQILTQFTSIIQSSIKQSIPQESFETIAASWACLTDESQKRKKIEGFLKNHGNESIVDAQHVLNVHGKKLVDKIIKGLSGYRVGWLTEPYNKYAILSFLPTSQLNDPSHLLSATHGTHTLSLISGRAPTHEHQVMGLAPQATVMMIKAFNDKGMSTKSLLIDAVKKAIGGNADILNLSLKIADRIDLAHESSKTLGQLIGLLPYVVAASGNDGASGRRPILSYPARFESVAFDVGAFGLENNMPIIPSFSQYEPNKGPLFVAPGLNILGAGIIPGLSDPSVYMYRSGTSMAAALTSGFLALLLGEFKNDFTKQEILTVCYHSTCKLACTDDWKTKTVLGVLDMRTALFVLHCIKRLRTEYPVYPFERLMTAVFFAIEEPMHAYSAKYLQGINFKNDFITFLKQKKPANYEYTKPSSVARGIEQIVNSLRIVLTAESSSSSNITLQANSKVLSSLPERAQKKLAQQDINTLPSARAQHIQRRLLAAREFADNLV
jgi:subtilisin family serine protease